jgi:long-chain fatty acid transport protein
MGYAYAQNPIDTNLGNSVGGVLPPGPAETVRATLQYLQSTVAVVNHHRISAGVGMRDVLPGMDLDLFAGGMFGAGESFGEFTSTDLASYWVGAGLTWRFGGCSSDKCCDTLGDDYKYVE